MEGGNMKCECGYDNPNGSKFCGKCGKEIIVPKKDIVLNNKIIYILSISIILSIVSLGTVIFQNAKISELQKKYDDALLLIQDNANAITYEAESLSQAFTNISDIYKSLDLHAESITDLWNYIYPYY